MPLPAAAREARGAVLILETTVGGGPVGVLEAAIGGGLGGVLEAAISGGARVGSRTAVDSRTAPERSAGAALACIVRAVRVADGAGLGLGKPLHDARLGGDDAGAHLGLGNSFHDARPEGGLDGAQGFPGHLRYLVFQGAGVGAFDLVGAG